MIIPMALWLCTARAVDVHEATGTKRISAGVLESFLRGSAAALWMPLQREEASISGKVVLAVRPHLDGPHRVTDELIVFSHAIEPARMAEQHEASWFDVNTHSAARPPCIDASADALATLGLLEHSTCHCHATIIHDERLACANHAAGPVAHLLVCKMRYTSEQRGYVQASSM